MESCDVKRSTLATYVKIVADILRAFESEKFNAKRKRPWKDYLQDDPSCRDLGTPVIWVKQGLEPPNFTGFFTSWDNEFWKTLPTYESIKNEIEDSNQTLLAMQQQAALYRNSRSEVEKFTFDALNVKNPDQLPTCVDPANKELYLNDEEFLRIFSMAYEEFEGLPKWKKLDLKKKVGLF
ncbi:villin-1-like [Ixodes scapularis]